MRTKNFDGFPLEPKRRGALDMVLLAVAILMSFTCFYFGLSAAYTAQAVLGKPHHQLHSNASVDSDLDY